MVEGFKDEAASQFEKVTKLQPSDQLSASFVKALKKVSEPPQQAPTQTNVAAAGQPAGTAPATNPPPTRGAPAAGQPTAATAEAPPQQQPEPPPPPPASLVGTWKAQPSPDLTITLTLQADGQVHLGG